MIFPTHLMLTGSEFHRVGVATEKAQVLTFVLTLGMNKLAVRKKFGEKGNCDSQIYC